VEYKKRQHAPKQRHTAEVIVKWHASKAEYAWPLQSS
jgi:hypothetical protein